MKAKHFDLIIVILSTDGKDYAHIKSEAEVVVSTVFAVFLSGGLLHFLSEKGKKVQEISVI